MIIETDTRNEGVVILRVSEVIKLGISAEFLEQVIAGLAEQNIVIDLGDIDYVESTGIDELVIVCAEEKDNNKVKFSSAPPQIRELFRMKGIPESNVFANEKKAVASFNTAVADSRQ